MMLDDAYAAVCAESSHHACLKSADQTKLERQKKELAEKVEAVRKFLGTRILWSAYAQDLSTRLPPDTVIQAFDGANELESDAKRGGAGKKSLTLRVLSRSKQDGSIPREIDAFFKSLRNHPLWMRDFLSVEVTDIKRVQARGMAPPSTSFTIVCSPKNAVGQRRRCAERRGAEGKREHK